MRHIKPISADVKALDWGLNSGLSGITVIIQSIVALLNAIGLLKGTNPESTENQK